MPRGERLRVAVNLLWLLPGVVGGSEEYLVRSLLAFADHGDNGIDVTLFAQPALAEVYPELNAAFALRSAPFRLTALGTPIGKLLRIVMEATWLRAGVRALRAQVVHHGGGSLPVGSQVLRDAARVLTLHDTQPLDLPENFSLAKRRYLSRRIPSSLRRADLVIGSSNFVLSSAVAHGACPERVALVPPCLGAVAPPSPGRQGSVLARLDVRAPYVLYPAITYPHKNHAVLVAALALTQGIQLVLTGGAASMEAELSESIAHAGLTDRVRRLGRLSAADFSHVFAGASALVFPSRYEGFGLPVLEAMALQVPVLASKATALTEVVGDSGWLLDPEDPVAWAAAIVAVLHEPATVAALVGSGRARAAMYTPQRTAQALGEAYWRAAETRRAS